MSCRRLRELLVVAASLVACASCAGTDETVGIDTTADTDETVSTDETVGIDATAGADETVSTDETVSVDATASTDAEEEPRGGVQWVLTAAEFEALCLQAYRAASDFLDDAISDTDWSALPGQTNAGELSPAIIFDIDETTVSNAEFQATYEPPFTNSKLDDWSDATIAIALPGAVDFVHLSQAAGVELFYITNRPCEPKAGVDHPCPQEQVTLQDLMEAGIATDAAHVLLANERPEWDREKVVRRNLVARTHRVIMLIGDDLGDFIECTRSSPRAPCTNIATIASRREVTREHSGYWGAGWFILPNPMHGSWTTVE